MTLKEADRFTVVKRLQNKNLTLRAAAAELGLSYRQMKRLLEAL